MLKYQGFVKKIFIGPLLGEIVLRILRLRRKKDFLQGRQKFFYFLNKIWPLLYLLIIVFPKLDPLKATGMALYLQMSQNVKNYLA
jgi:hypothetical protein